MSASGNPTEEEREHVIEIQLGGEGVTARYPSTCPSQERA